MNSLTDFTIPLDMAYFDSLVTAFYRSSGAQQLQAKQTLEVFQQHPDAWKRVDAILETSNTMEAKFIALQILESLIKTMWKVLPPPQRQGIKNFIVAFIIKCSSDEASLDRNRTLLSKLNIVLVQILKQDWPQNWPSFIPEIVNSSKANLSLCENNMVILKLLSEEIFDYSAEQMTQTKIKNLKNQMCGEFSEVFQLCHEVLEKAQKPSLIKVTLETLLRFLNWIPLGYVFETNLLDILSSRFLSVPAFRNVTLKCFTEIGSLQVGQDYDAKFVLLFSAAMSSVTSMLPLKDFTDLYENSSDAEQNYIQNVGLFISSFLSNHLRIIEQAIVGNPSLRSILFTAHSYLLRISAVKDREVFKVGLEYWTKLVSDLYDEVQSLPMSELPLLNTNSASSPNAVTLRKNAYTDILSQLRVLMIERMVKPEEVLIVENDEGEIVRESLKESDTIVLYKSMREVLVYLTHLDVSDTEAIMMEKLARQMDGSEWSWDNLNKLNWAIGSISGAMTEDTEKRFLVSVIKDLLALVEMKRGKDNKAVVAANIMYIVGQYPRFLKAHWKFLKTVVNKLFEFMHELHEGVQDMACDTFIKIAQKCKRHFVIQQPMEVMPFIDEILANLDSITSDLQPQQVHTVYEAIGHMISAQVNRQQQERLVSKLMELPNRAWDQLMAQAAQNPDLLNSPDNIKVLGNIMKTNVAACSSIGSPFFSQVGRIYLDLLGLYKAVSGLVSQSVATQGLIATKTPRVRGLRTIKKEILKLIDTYISKAEDLMAVYQNMIPPLLEAVLGDYAANVEPAKDAEVLNVMASIVTRLSNLMTERVPVIFEATFECTLNMINKNFEEYPEHRVGFFKLLQAINAYCFKALLSLPGPQFKLFLDSVVWAFKHTLRDIGDIGLTICQDLIVNFSKADPQMAVAFFQTYTLSIVQDVFFVLTSTSHKAGFRLQSSILMTLIGVVDTMQVPIYDPASVGSNSMSNQDFLKGHLRQMLQQAFPHLSAIQMTQFTNGLFLLYKDATLFKNHLRDFLVMLKEFAGEDSQDLFLEDPLVELENKKKAEFEAALKIPGMIKPHDRPDEGMMD